MTLSGRRRPAWFAALVGATVGGVVLGPMPVAAAAASARLAMAYDRPGQPVALSADRKLNFRCIGHGHPTVILESGFGANAAAWWKVQPLVATTNRVCAYDRAGYGFSDPGPLPRDGAAIARDLDRGLRLAGVRGPLVLVGHSSGGLYVRLLAARRRKDVVGMVLVDPSVEHQDRRFAAILGQGAGSVEGIRQRVTACAQAMEARPGVDAARDACVPRTAGAHDRAIGLRSQTWRTQVSEIETLFAATSDEVDRVGDLLKTLPVIILTATPTGLPAGADDPGGQVWQAFHQDLAARFRPGQQRLVKSSHLMMIDRPDAIVAALHDVVAAAGSPVARRDPTARDEAISGPKRP
ncbi:alpha/beta hydrolase [Phenylobacterium sp.]|uniref:alpha/beta fold hydrolase n=1 Tax=Phenylobacterium sp. TaxID=1871053 RepID=UPI00286A3F2F|nr:alpha/beta hydrolase [Phenylobacterium sp.]